MSSYLSGTISKVEGNILTILDGNNIYNLVLKDKSYPDIGVKVFAHATPTDKENEYVSDIEPMYIFQVTFGYVMFIIRQAKVYNPRAFLEYLKKNYPDDFVNHMSELAWDVQRYYLISPFPDDLIPSHKASTFFKKWIMFVNDKRLKMYNLKKICTGMNSQILYKRLFNNPFSLPIGLNYLVRICKCLHITPTKTDITMNRMIVILHKLITNGNNTCMSLDSFKDKELIIKEASKYHLVVVSNFITFDYMYDMENHVSEKLKNHKIISGSAGTGKTTLINEITKKFDTKKVPYVVASFTGKAVSRIKEVGVKNAYTMHLLMAQKRGGFKHLVIDEASMVSTTLMYTFLRCFTHEYKIIFVGDSNQLTPIEHGKLFKHLTRHDNENHMKLTTVHRTDCEGILELADYILRGGKPLNSIVNSGKDVYMCDANIPKMLVIIKTLVSKGVKPTDISLITPFNEDRILFNEILKKIFLSGKVLVMDQWGNEWQKDQLVMMTSNDYNTMIMNGETGMIMGYRQATLTVKFGKRFVKFTTEEVKGKSNTRNLVTAYCVTAHKSEGSEHDNVIIYIKRDPKKYRDFLTNNLIYTSVTRAKKKLFIFCDVDNFESMINNKDPETMELLPLLLL
uniref:RecD helicase /ATP-dependent exoDNAse n=1 Tax=Pithovirus LCPAC403 TaxID=2506596 RepID=A0A481ZEM0_9VIRU|nr:MAG: RecD helicase /ATP-dependent exoDNAse [Pithovirus LCPAC403]